jgi:hypothetical protein
MPEVMSKEQLLQEFANAYEQLIETAIRVAQHGVTRQGETWGPREVVAHLAGWEVMATARMSNVAAGMPPFVLGETQQVVDAINAMIVTMAGEQSLEALCDILRQAYRNDVAILSNLNDTLFQPGEYVYERTKDVLEHCQEHMQDLTSNLP